MAPNAKATVQAKFDDVIVIALLMELKAAGISVGKKALDTMSDLHGNRTATGFQHALRAPIKLANELLEKQKGGEKLGPADLGRSPDGETNGATAAKATPKKRVAAAEGGSAKKKPATKKAAKPVDSGAEGRATISIADDRWLIRYRRR